MADLSEARLDLLAGAGSPVVRNLVVEVRLLRAENERLTALLSAHARQGSNSGAVVGVIKDELRASGEGRS